jgi:hypothetical protein
MQVFNFDPVPKILPKKRLNNEPMEAAIKNQKIEIEVKSDVALNSIIQNAAKSLKTNISSRSRKMVPISSSVKLEDKVIPSIL